MRPLAIHNPFSAPVYHEDTVDSTMNVSRMLARRGEPHGTVMSADFQEAGRGRTKGRVWDMERGSSLPFTVLLRFPAITDIPRALTVRTGLAVSRAIEDFAPALAGSVFIKWPNDIMIGRAKAAGILTEADDNVVHIGIGINAAQKKFPHALRGKATSIALAAGMEITPAQRYTLLEKVLMRLYAELESSGETGWHGAIENRLYQKGEPVCFAAGAADSGEIVKGTLCGIGPEGELLIIPAARSQGEASAFSSGELLFAYGETPLL